MRSRCPSPRAAPTPRPEQTDVEGFAVLEPKADGFRNYLQVALQRADRGAAGRPRAAAGPDGAADDGAGRRPARAGRQPRRRRSTACFTDRPGQLTNDFFVNLLDMRTGWKKVDDDGDEIFVGTDRDHRRGAVDGDAHRPGVRLQLAAARAVGGLCLGRRGREVRQGLRRGLGQGDEPRPVRPWRKAAGPSLPGGEGGPEGRMRGPTACG